MTKFFFLFYQRLPQPAHTHTRTHVYMHTCILTSAKIGEYVQIDGLYYTELH